MASTGFLFFLSALIIHLISLTTSQQPTYCFHMCLNTTGNFTANSAFLRNLNLTLSSLYANSTRVDGFYNTSTGQSPDSAYGLFLCRGDISPSLCQSCVNATSADIRTRCPNQKEAFIWYDECMLRYSNRSIFADMVESPKVFLWNFNNVKDPGMFTITLGNLMNSLVRSAVSGSSGKLYAARDGKLVADAGDANVTVLTVYALVQCTPDISQFDCQICLSGAIADIPSFWSGKQGARVVTPSCNIRFDSYLFYQPPAVAPAPSPPPTSTNPSGKESNTSRLTPKKKKIPSRTVIIATVTSVILIVCICIFLRMRKQREKVEMDAIGSVESLQFDFGTIKVATEFFSDANKLGQGGFGAVYKGKLYNGQDIAVKRLSIDSRQGDQEFKNEVLLVAKLQHRNLVRLLGFCTQGNERLLIYEFVPNTSLDHYLFNPIKRERLDWERRYQIIGGISRGLLYLHEDSRLRIIHRDLKASNILLDAEMNPKIADFGMARLFVVGQTQGSTNRIVGTYGYMAPEYAMHGYFSVKSDVYSFGVLLLEIVSGQKNSYRFHNGEDVEDLLSYAWKNWKEGTASNLIDPTLRNGSVNEIMRCIHIGLLCVQENEVNRPTMASVVQFLSSSSLTLPVPSEPTFFMQSKDEMKMPLVPEHNSVNEVSITELYPR